MMRAELTALVARRRAEVSTVTDLVARSGSARLSNAADWHAVVSVDPSEPGQWRVTYLDADMSPVGHADHASSASAVEAAVRDRFDTHRANEMTEDCTALVAQMVAAKERQMLDLLDVRVTVDGSTTPAVADVADQLRSMIAEAVTEPRALVVRPRGNRHQRRAQAARQRGRA